MQLLMQMQTQMLKCPGMASWSCHPKTFNSCYSSWFSRLICGCAQRHWQQRCSQHLRGVGSWLRGPTNSGMNLDVDWFQDVNVLINRLLYVCILAMFSNRNSFVTRCSPSSPSLQNHRCPIAPRKSDAPKSTPSSKSRADGTSVRSHLCESGGGLWCQQRWSVSQIGTRVSKDTDIKWG